MNSKIIDKWPSFCRINNYPFQNIYNIFNNRMVDFHVKSYNRTPPFGEVVYAAYKFCVFVVTFEIEFLYLSAIELDDRREITIQLIDFEDLIS